MFAKRLLQAGTDVGNFNTKDMSVSFVRVTWPTKHKTVITHFIGRVRVVAMRGSCNFCSNKEQLVVSMRFPCIGPLVTPVCPSTGKYPRVNVSGYGHANLVGILRNANVKVAEGTTPLMKACRNCHVDTVVRLLDYGAKWSEEMLSLALENMYS
eukprot:scaffold10501_cov141-Amphora_coffeaeformis.AAC.8